MGRIVIIGSGIGGLVAGNLLAEKGHKVTIFESHNAPGGYVSGFWRKGFYFESGTLSFESSDMVFQAMKDIGVYDQIPFVRQHARWIHDGLDYRTRSLDDLKRALYAGFPSEKAALDRCFAETDKIIRALSGISKPKNLLQALAFPVKLGRIVQIFRRYGNITAPEFAAEYFAPGSPLYRILANFAYPDMSAAFLGMALWSFTEDYWTVETGMLSWAEVLAEHFKSLGGELRLNHKVDRILTRNGKAVGVNVMGQDVPADYVISASDYKKTFLDLLDDKALIPPDMREKIESAAVSEGFFTVYLGLNLPQERLREYLGMPHVAYSPEGPEADIHDSGDAEYFKKSVLMLYSPSLLNEGLSPENKSSLMLQAMTPHRWMNNWGGGDREVYRELKNKVKRQMIAKASALIPDIETCIEFEDAATPLTYERYTSNSDGATSAWSWNPRKKFYDRGMNAQIKTPVGNLLIGSCWAVQIGGVPGAISAAAACARAI